jgi:NADPH-dependent curcumin reductase CurA
MLAHLKGAMMTDRINRQWRLAARPEGLIKESDFEWVEEPVGDLEEGQVLVRAIYLSLDPANRGWVRKGPSYVEPVEVGEVMRGLTVGVVESSRNDRFAEGDIVSGAIGWQDYGVSDGSDLRPIPPAPLPLTAHLGLFGIVGLTAYFGLLDVGQPKAGETLVVSGAAGAIRQMSEWHAEGRLKYRVDVYDGLETAPRNINRLFDGSHSGKLIIKVGEEPSIGARL